METWELVAETREWVGPITMTLDDVEVDDFEVSVCATGVRPVPLSFAAADVLEGESGVLVGTGTSRLLSPGSTYTIYVRASDSPEQPIKIAGKIKAL